jgi:hypothetical protein
MAPILPRPSTPPGIPPPEAQRFPSRLSFGVVCSSNINRSMEAHVVLGNAGEFKIQRLWCLSPHFFWLMFSLIFSGLQVESYGTGTQVRYVSPNRRFILDLVYLFLK